MPPDERRAAVLRAAVPLVRERGAQVSTRELAEAAGVAEGTLFRVFPDKRALVCAALAEAMDPAPLERSLAAVDRSLPLEQRVRHAIEIVSEHTEGVVQLMTALHELADDGAATRRGPRTRARSEHEARDARLLDALAAVFEADALRVTPLQAAGLVRGVVLGDRMPGMPDGARLTPAAVAACLVRGLLAGADTGRDH